MWFPALPTPDSIHPLIVHLPLVLLLVVPVLVLIALLMGKRGDGVTLAALIVLIIGTVAAVLAVKSGHNAEHAVKAAGLINDVNHPVLHEHEQFAEYARNVFLGLAGLFIVMVALGVAFRKRLRPWVRPVSLGIFFLLCIPGCLLLLDAGDLGGRLVHKHGVHANITSPDPAVVQARADFVRATKAPAAAAKP